jgi:hypothetical protein
MSRTFNGGGYSVTVNDDRSIRVKPGDWISKYSAAIYGDPLVNWNRFKRKNAAGQYIDLVDPNKITAGEVLYHPGPLPGEPRYGKPEHPIGITPPTAPPADGLVPDRVYQFFRYLKQWLSPVNDWKFAGSAGIDLSASLLAGHYTRLSVQRVDDPEETWFHAIGAGIGIGPEDIAGSLAISPPDFWGPGFVGKFPSAGRSLSLDEICGNYMLLDFSFGLVLGYSFTLLMFGLNTPWDAAIRSIGRYLRGHNDPLVIPWVFNGAVVMCGPSWSTPNLGVSCKIGWMHRTECVTG